MSKVVSRLLTFFIGIPLVIAIVCVHAYNHLALHIFVCAIAFCAAHEMYNLFANRMELLPRPFVVACTVFLPLSTAFTDVFPAFAGRPPVFACNTAYLALVVVFVAVLFAEVVSARDFSGSLHRMSGSLFIVMYAGFLISFVPRMTVFFKNGTSVSVPCIATFLLLVFFCDSIAWLFGVLFGKNNRGLVKASPNKSIAGFAGGFAGSVSVGLVCRAVWPHVFSGSASKLVALAVLVALAAETGDLAESIFKRSSQLKDSGSIIPGRGGILDSIDSILLAAPLYYIMVQILYGPLS